VQCRIFSTIFNPTGAQLGNKVLRQRLRGPSLAAYYPRRIATFKDLKQLYPGYEMYHEEEEDRLEHIQIAKSRGKGAPKKKKSAAGEYSRVIVGWVGLFWADNWCREQEEGGLEKEVVGGIFGAVCSTAWRFIGLRT